MPIESIQCPHCRKKIPLTDVLARQIKEKLDEDYRLQIREKDELIGELRERIEGLRHKAESGSQQLQGEVLELDLEERLQSHFPSDQLKPVPKGIRGPDILQEIYDRRDRCCGVIMWETKRTKEWGKGWIEKLKQDQRAANADVAVLLTRTLPKGCERFSQIEGVWVTNYACAIELATVLRHFLIEIATTKRAAAGKHSKLADLHDYLISANFRSRIEAVVETFIVMKKELERERRAYEGIWRRRERQIDKIVSNISCMAGDMDGIIDSNVLQIKSLALPALADGDDEE